MQEEELRPISNIACHEVVWKYVVVDSVCGSNTPSKAIQVYAGRPVSVSVCVCVLCVVCCVLCVCVCVRVFVPTCLMNIHPHASNTPFDRSRYNFRYRWAVRSDIFNPKLMTPPEAPLGSARPESCKEKHIS